MNTITTEVLRVTTQQQAKNADWMAQDNVRKTTQVWVEEANAANTERMRQESTQHLGPIEEDLGSQDPV